MKGHSRADFFGLLSNKPADDLTFPRTVSNLGIKPYNGKWGRDQIMHLLRRSLFGVTKSDFEYFSNLSLSDSLDVLLRQSPPPAAPVNAYNNDSFVDAHVPFGMTWTDCDVIDENSHCADQKRLESLQEWWVGLMLNQDRSLTEKMRLFWHNHLAIEFTSTPDGRRVYTYFDAISKHCLQNAKELTYAVITSPGMTQYLSNNQSNKETPNENLAREMQELFTIGKGPGSQYTQQDVVAAAKVLTGVGNDYRQYVTFFHPYQHDTSDKQFSGFYNNTVIKGRTGEAGISETRELIEMIFRNRETAMHTCRCLYRWFVNYEIDHNVETRVIEPLADILVNSEYEIAPVLRALLGSEHFFDTVYIGCMVKNPVDYLAGFLRQFNESGIRKDLSKQYSCWNTVKSLMGEMDMEPGSPPNVAGWPAYYLYPAYYQLWLNSATIVARFSAIDSFISLEEPVHSDQNAFLQADVLGFTAALSNPADLNALIAESTSLLTPVQFDAAQIDFLKNILSGSSEIPLLVRDPDRRSWSDAWLTFKAQPENEAIKRIVLSRLKIYYRYLMQQMECQLM